jgi:hypothetical protein
MWHAQLLMGFLNKKMGKAMRKIISVLLIGAAALSITSCATTRFVSTWTAPDTANLRFEKILVLVIHNDENMRRLAEDEIVRLVKQAQAIPAYSLIPATEIGDLDKVMARIKQAGIDGAVVLRVVGESQRLTYVPGATTWYPGPYYGSLGGYHSWAWNAVQDPAYLRKDTLVRVETNIYSVINDKLLWSGQSETVNPMFLNVLVKDVATAAAEELRNQKLIP